MEKFVKLATKLSYLGILWALTLPIFAWLGDPSIDIAAVGPYIAGLGVPMGTLTFAMAARKIGHDQIAAHLPKEDPHAQTGQ